MRLVDADAYKKLHKSKCVGDCGCCPSITDGMICTLIDEAPTVKEAIVPLKCKYCGFSYKKCRRPENRCSVGAGSGKTSSGTPIFAAMQENAEK